MGLIDLKTDLKSLKFGKDRPRGGSSNQPYVQKDIPEGDPIQSPDFLLRNGFLNPVSIVKDAERIGKYFIDLKSPSGLLFIAKQNLLSRLSVRTQASGILNDYAYSPTSTLAQVIGNSVGIHTNKQGINPILGFGESYTPQRYFDAVRKSNTITETKAIDAGFLEVGDNNTFGIPTISVGTEFITIATKNRLLQLTEKFVYSKNDNVNILSYGGGPGSILGIGKTNIKFSTDNNGNTLRTGLNNKAVNDELIKGPSKAFISGKNQTITIGSPLGITTQYSSSYNLTYEPTLNIGPVGPSASLYTQNTANQESLNNSSSFKSTLGLSTIYSSSYDLTTNPNLNIGPVGPSASLVNDNNQFANNTFVYTEDLLKQASRFSNSGSQDFRAELRKTNKKISPSSAASTEAPSYNINEGKTIEYRVNLGDPGKKGKNLTKYSLGAYNGSAIDQINALDLYQAGKVTSNKVVNDLVKFRIAAYNPSAKNFVFMHFRAFIDSFSDSYNGNWDSQKYMGRGEEFYNYTGFNRSISMGWTVAAQSKAELIPMYHKLNFLASNLAPDYSSAGYMRGPLVYLTVGGYLYEQPGFIKSLTYDIPQESTWEIGINETGTSDSTVKELPHMIKVSGFSFIPIHKFLVAKQNGNSYKTQQFEVGNVVNGFASQRYIALKSGTGGNKNGAAAQNNYDYFQLDKTIDVPIDPSIVYNENEDN